MADQEMRPVMVLLMRPDGGEFRWHTLEEVPKFTGIAAAVALLSSWQAVLPVMPITDNGLEWPEHMKRVIAEGLERRAAGG